MAPMWRRMWLLCWALGALLGMASYNMRYHLQEPEGGGYVVHGVPFPAFAFDDQGRDYVGLITLPMIGLNFMVWALAPQLAFFVVGRIGRPRRTLEFRK